MTLRYLELLIFLVLGAVPGAWAGSAVWTALGSLAGASCWYVLDMLRAVRVLRWIRDGQWQAPPDVRHVWGLLLEKMVRLQKTAHQKNMESQARLDEFLSAIQASPNGVLLLDSELRIEWCNRTAADHLGVDPVRDTLQHVTNLVRDPRFTQYLTQSEFNAEVQITGAGATASKPVQISIQLHPYGERRKLMLTRDVTALEQAEAMRRDFVANVSHEIRTPLTVLTGFVETLQTLPLSAPEQAKYLSFMARQAQRMEVLVSDLLTLSKLEGSPSPNRQNWFGASGLAARCLQDARGLSEALGQPERLFSLEADAPEFELAGSSAELTSAVSNLLSNAIRYSPAEGCIEMSLGIQADGWAWMSVKDSGPGIAPEHIPRLTERFYRVDRSRSRETGGTGLGLAIVKHVVQRHGGALGVESVLGKGSRFTLRFPPDRVRPM
jgi:two-component system phosphate regulon sensor histidine kinase PhoR